jgi:hypothetical protein
VCADGQFVRWKPPISAQCSTLAGGVGPDGDAHVLRQAGRDLLVVGGEPLVLDVHRGAMGEAAPVELTPAEMLATMRRAGEVAERELLGLWPDGSGARVVESRDDIWFFVRTVEWEGVTVRRTGELRDSVLWDVIELGQRPPHVLPRGAEEVGPGRVSVWIPKTSWWRRRPRPRNWTYDEVEMLCRHLDAIDAAVLGLRPVDGVGVLGVG